MRSLIFIAACGVFSCIMWDLLPCPKIEPMPSAVRAQNLSHWSTIEIPGVSFDLHCRTVGYSPVAVDREILVWIEAVGLMCSLHLCHHDYFAHVPIVTALEWWCQSATSFSLLGYLLLLSSQMLFGGYVILKPLYFLPTCTCIYIQVCQTFFFFFFFFRFMAVLGFFCCAQAFSSCGEWELLSSHDV